MKMLITKYLKLESKLNLILLFTIFYSCNTFDKNQTDFQFKITYQHDKDNYSCEDCHQTKYPTNTFYSKLITNWLPKTSEKFSEKCVTCHDNMIKNDLLPHNQKFEVSHLEKTEFDCNHCHFEHKGLQKKYILTQNDCENCHSNKSNKFLDIHKKSTLPTPMVNWKFNHSNHQEIHFDKFDINFDCVGCHQINDNGEFNPIQFEKSCTTCHHHEEQFSQRALTFLQIPGLDYEVLMDEDINIGSWPIDAGIDLEESINPFIFSELTIKEQSIYYMLLDEEIELIDLSDAEEFLEDIGTLVWGIKKVLFRFKNSQKLKSTFGLTDLYEINFFNSTIDNWFPELKNEIIAFQNGDAEETFEYEDYNPDDSSINQLFSSTFDFNIQYKVKNHKDQIIENLFSNHFSKLQETIKNDNPGNCLKCHITDENQFVWKNNKDNVKSIKNPLLKQFSHKNHIKENKCQDCHLENENTFLAIEISTCENCHTQIKNNYCLSCHSYHPQKLK